MKHESTKFETLMGGAELTVRLRDGSSAKVRVKQLAIAEYPELLKRLEDEGTQIELYCECPGPSPVPVPAEWAKQLTADSHDAIMEKAEELNRDFFGRWLQRRMKRLEAMRPGVTEEFFAKLTGPRPSSLPSSSPASRASAG